MPAVIAIIGVDHFIKENETCGLDFGGKALFEFAQACKRGIREAAFFENTIS